MKKILILLLLSVYLNAQITIPPEIAPENCKDEPIVLAHEINILNEDSTINAWGYIDLQSQFLYSSNDSILQALSDGSFELTDSTYYRNRVAQGCAIGCCNFVVNWSDWAYNVYVPPQLINEAIDDTITISKANTTQTIDVSLNDTRTNCEPVTYDFINALEVAIVNNNDGTFDATPIDSGDWSFEYIVTCADGITSDTALVFYENIPLSGGIDCTAISATIQIDPANENADWVLNGSTLPNGPYNLSDVIQLQQLEDDINAGLTITSVSLSYNAQTLEITWTRTPSGSGITLNVGTNNQVIVNCP